MLHVLHKKMNREILWLRSSTTGKEFPTVLDSADTDMDWDGYIPFVDNEGKEIVMAQTKPSEVQDFGLTQKRLRAELKREDLTYIDLLRTERCKLKRNEPFQSFLKRSEESPTKHFYRDIFDPEGEAVTFKKESISGYVSHGGKIAYYPPVNE